MAHDDFSGTRPRFRTTHLFTVLTCFVWAVVAPADEPPAPPANAPQEISDSTPPDAPDDENGDGFVKRRFRSVFGDDHTNGNGEGARPHWGPLYLSPTIVSTGSSVGPRLELWQPDLAGSGLDVHAAAAYSVRQYAYYGLRLGRLPRRHGGPPALSTASDRFAPLTDIERLSGVESRFDLYAGYRHRDYPEEDFYGIGLGTSDDDRTDYRLRDDFVELVAAYHFSPRFALTARGGLLRTSLGAGRDAAFPDLASRFDDATAPGLGHPPDEVILTAGLLADLRDEPGNPHRGTLLTAGLSRYQDTSGGAFEFTRAAVDVRLYVPLGTHRHVIATRALASFDWPDAGSRVPFYLQSSLGGSQVLRGYPAFRFRDDRLVALSAEYRWELLSKLELAAFYDAGQVAPETSDLRLADLRTGWGAGVRLKSRRDVLLRFDVARSREATRYLIKLSPAF
jgi:surface antigen Omp85-like protein